MIIKNRKFETQKSPFFRDQKNNNPIPVENCIFIDAETVSLTENFSDLHEEMQARFIAKYSKNLEENETIDQYYKNMAGLFPEYGRIICISLGYTKDNEFKVFSFVGEEYELLLNFAFALQTISAKIPDPWIVGQNILYFDSPFISRRCIINGINPPALLHKPFAQPWTKKVIDIAQEWKCGNSTMGDATLATLCNVNVLNIESPKNGEVNGEKMSEFWYSTQNIETVSSYCEKDVICTYEIFYKLQNLTYPTTVAQ